jgi:hypothetical protein
MAVEAAENKPAPVELLGWLSCAVVWAAAAPSSTGGPTAGAASPATAQPGRGDRSERRFWTVTGGPASDAARLRTTSTTSSRFCSEEPTMRPICRRCAPLATWRRALTSSSAGRAGCNLGEGRPLMKEFEQSLSIGAIVAPQADLPPRRPSPPRLLAELPPLGIVFVVGTEPAFLHISEVAFR